ncbi:MAG TPA: hypothetical protein VF103_04475 [Polyangiaceae bacterium]
MAEAKENTETTVSRGIDSSLLGVGADGALAAVQKAGENAEALVEAWVKAGNAGAVNELAERGAGKARKAARRGLNVLKARGIAIPDRARVASVAGPKEQAVEEGWLIAPDPQGTSVVAISSRTPSSRARVVFVFLNPNVGVYRVQTAEVSQSQLRESLAQIAPGGSYKAVNVPVGWVRQRVADARRFQKEKNVPEPLGFSAAEPLLAPPSSAPVSHPLDAVGLDPGDDEEKALAAKSADLHNLPEFGGWLPTRVAVDELLEKLGETLTPGEEPDAKLVQERLGEEVGAATDRYFTPERRADLVALMKDSALSVLAREGEARGLEVVATMRAIERCGLITDPPREVAFLRAFFDKAIAVLASRGGGQLRIPVPKREPAPASDP